INWPNPADITYGTALSSTQLNASAGDVGGSFQYTPASGTVLTAGEHTLSVSFTPTDTTDFSATTAQATINVTKAGSTTILTQPSASYFGDSVTLTATVGASYGTATGTITFLDGAASLGTGSVNGSGVATLAVS